MTTAIKVFLGLAIFPYPFVLWMTWFIRGEADSLLGEDLERVKLSLAAPNASPDQP